MEAPSPVLPPPPPAFSGHAVAWQPQQTARAVPRLSPALSGAGGVSSNARSAQPSHPATPRGFCLVSSFPSTAAFAGFGVVSEGHQAGPGVLLPGFGEMLLAAEVRVRSILRERSVGAAAACLGSSVLQRCSGLFAMPNTTQSCCSGYFTHVTAGSKLRAM